MTGAFKFKAHALIEISVVLVKRYVKLNHAREWLKTAVLLTVIFLTLF